MHLFFLHLFHDSSSQKSELPDTDLETVPSHRVPVFNVLNNEGLTLSQSEGEAPGVFEMQPRL